MDDVGIDQLPLFGYNTAPSPSTPTIDTIARGGVRFQNAWSMPACTTSRAVFFDGRFPMRTNVLGALGPDDLANSMVSPYEMTAPKLLAQRGYASGLFGKFHLTLPGHDPAGYGAVHALGWDYYAGWLDETGDPASIDTTAGGVAPEGTWSCGFVLGEAQGGADVGACYLADGSCSELSANGGVPPGRVCMERGGILDPGAACQTPPPAHLDFERLSAHYVSPFVINHADGSVERVPLTDPRARRFRTSVAVDEAISWIKGRPANQPWMATVSFPSAHTPVVQPPIDQDSDSADSSLLDCAQSTPQRTLTDLMIQSLDQELGRLLVSTGLAQRDAAGQLVYRSEETHTMIIIIGDNGSLGSTTKTPFDPQRAKGTAYQTGVWVPLVIAGPLVNTPNRVAHQMINVADLFALFGEVAGVDVAKAVPRTIDALPLLPYLTNPDQESIRTWNFTQVGPNLQANGAANGPCTISQTCTQIPVSKSVCHDNNGKWWGPSPDDSSAPQEGMKRCCDVKAYLLAKGQSATFGISPTSSMAIRNAHYKLVENSSYQYVSSSDPCVFTKTSEFYEIDEAVPQPKIDRADSALPLNSLTAEQQQNHDALQSQLTALTASMIDCVGDGNLDAVIDDKDLADWYKFAGQSSVYDINLDGLTDAADQAIIQQHLGQDCRTSAQ